MISAQTDNKGHVEQLINTYINDLINGRFNQASSCWKNDYIQDVYKFGIWYDDADFKYDCNSPLIPYLDDLRSGKLKFGIKAFSLAVNLYKIIITLQGEDFNTELDYYQAQKFGVQWFLTPHYWPEYSVMQTRDSKYFTVHYINDNQINDSALARADQLVEKIGAQIGFETRDFERIEADKITYILCQTLSQLKEFTGVAEPGWHDPANNFLLSTYLPHGRIIAEFLITYKLGEKSLHTHPFIEKGLGVALGDKAGTALENFYQLTAYSLQEKFFGLEDLLTIEDFAEKTGGPDFAYTLAGFFFRYMLTEVEIDKLLDLYKNLSRDEAILERLSANDVKDIIKNSTGYSWGKLEKGFGKYFEDKFQKTIYPVDQIHSTEVVFQSGTPKFGITISQDDKWYYIDSYAFNKLTPVYLAVLLKPAQPQEQNFYLSNLFPKLLSFRDYKKEFYGIVFNDQEYGVYDYLTNEITGKYIKAMDMDSDSVNDGHVRFKFSKDLFAAPFNAYTVELVEMP